MSEVPNKLLNEAEEMKQVRDESREFLPPSSPSMPPPGTNKRATTSSCAQGRATPRRLRLRSWGALGGGSVPTDACLVPLPLPRKTCRLRLVAAVVGHKELCPAGGSQLNPPGPAMARILASRPAGGWVPI